MILIIVETQTFHHLNMKCSLSTGLSSLCHGQGFFLIHATKKVRRFVRTITFGQQTCSCQLLFGSFWALWRLFRTVDFTTKQMNSAILGVEALWCQEVNEKERFRLMKMDSWKNIVDISIVSLQECVEIMRHSSTPQSRNSTHLTTHCSHATQPHTR